MLPRFTILAFDGKAARQAAEVVGQLKTKRKSIDKPDIFIAATAVVHGLTLDKINKRLCSHEQFRFAKCIKTPNKSIFNNAAKFNQ